MRTFAKPGYDWTMSFIEFREICEEVYGVPYDLQMGERGQGEYDVVTTGQRDDRESYPTGMGQGHTYQEKYPEGYSHVYFDGGEIDPETGEYVDDSQAAIAHWQAQKPVKHFEWQTEAEYDRPFDTVGPDGQYTFWQPSLQTVINDLANEGEIPEGTYMITIDW